MRKFFNVSKAHPINTKSTLSEHLTADVEAVNRIPIVSQLLDVVCRTTGMRFAAIARVTEDRWITCSAKDDIAFGLKPGDELKLETTICNEIRQTNEAVVISHVDQDQKFCNHHTPALYGFQSYISFPIYKKDGSFFGTLCAIDPQPANINSPEVMGMFKLFADLISFHLSTIEEMDSSAAKLAEERKTSELREEFIAILGHDLKNPIATTRLSADILLKTSKDEITRRHASMIKSTSYRMTGLIENILDFARGRLGEGIKLKKTANNELLQKSLQQIINEVQATSPHRTIEIKMQLEKSIKCDTDRIAQLFANLLSNADLHGADHEPIKVLAIATKEEFQLSVANAGEKIPDSAKEHLFQPFYRKNVKPQKKGLGLGLYIASEIAKAHNGRMEVKSSEKETKFTFRMPLEN